MKNKLWVKILYILTLIIQVGIVIGTFVVEYLTNKKAGIMALKSKRSRFFKIQSILTLLISLILYIVMSSSYFINMLAYHYFIMAFALVLMIQVLVLFVTWLIDKKFKQ